MRISVHARGGFSVYGGHYDPHCDEAVILVRDGETAALTIEFPSAPTTPSVSLSGAASTDPVASGNKLTATLSSLSDGGRADYTATVGGETRVIRVRARSRSYIDRYCFDGDLSGA